VPDDNTHENVIDRVLSGSPGQPPLPKVPDEKGLEEINEQTDALKERSGLPELSSDERVALAGQGRLEDIALTQACARFLEKAPEAGETAHLTKEAAAAVARMDAALGSLWDTTLPLAVTVYLWIDALSQAISSAVTRYRDYLAGPPPPGGEEEHRLAAAACARARQVRDRAAQREHERQQARARARDAAKTEIAEGKQRLGDRKRVERMRAAAKKGERPGK
jgi:hypothetical protein